MGFFVALTRKLGVGYYAWRPRDHAICIQILDLGSFAKMVFVAPSRPSTYHVRLTGRDDAFCILILRHGAEQKRVSQIVI